MNTSYTILPIPFSYLFDEIAKPIKDYLKRIPRERAIGCALFISNYTANSDWHGQLYDLCINNTIKCLCNAKMRIHEAEFPNVPYVLFTPLTGLELLKHVFTIPAYDHKPINHEWQICLLKAITIINSELLNEGPRYNDKSIKRFIKSVKYYRYSLDDRVLVYPAVFRAMCLLEFLEEKKFGLWANLSKELTNKLNVDTLENYIKRKIYLLSNLNLKPKTKNEIIRFKFGRYTVEYYNV